MAPRLMHTKSRNGCTRCKTRKVKCDEVKPICGACGKHGVDCSFPPRSHRHISPPDASTYLGPSNSSAIAVDTLIPGVYANGNGITLPETRERRLLELRLMHRYMNCFRDMFAGIHSPSLAGIWQEAVPTLAMENPFLLHALFAVTALHYVTTEPDPSSPQSRSIGGDKRLHSGNKPLPPSSTNTGLSMAMMKEARVLYFDLAVPGQREAISNLQAANADAACIATILISHSGFLMTHVFDPDTDSYAPPVEWLRLASGIRTIIAQTRPLLSKDSAIMRIIDSVGEIDFERADLTEHGRFFAPLLNHHSHSESEADMKIYSRVLSIMGYIRTGFVQDESLTNRTRRTLAFASVVSREYITFVSEHRPRALAILACFFAMSKEVENIWWFTGVAETHVNGLTALLPPAWKALVEWPHAIIHTPSSAQRTVLYQRPEMIANI